MRGNAIQHKKFRKLPLFLAVAGGLYGASAFANDQLQEPQDPQEEEQVTESAPAQSQAPTELDRITVTGSLLRRVEYDSISPVQVITADTSVAVGMVDTA